MKEGFGGWVRKLFQFFLSDASSVDNKGKKQKNLSEAAERKLRQNLGVEYDLYEYLLQRLKKQYKNIEHLSHERGQGIAE